MINGLDSKRARADEARKLVNWGFRSFSSSVLVQGGESVTELPVWHGTQARVAVTPAQRFAVVAPRGGRRKMAVTVTYEKPLLAPIRKGDALAVMRVTMPGLAPQEMKLVATQDVGRSNIFGRAFQSLGYLLFE